MSLPQLPPIVLGGAGLSDARLPFLETWYAEGGRAVDTAHVYGGGRSERTLGAFIAAHGIDDLVLVGKACHPDASGQRVSRAHLFADVQESLHRLGRERLDVLLLHRDDEAVPITDIMQWLDELVRTGLADAVGVSNWSLARIHAAQEHARAQGTASLAYSSPQLSAVTPSAPPWPGCRTISGDAEARAYHAQEHAPRVLAWQPLAAGFLASEEAPQRQEAQVFDTPANRAVRAELAQHAAANGRTLAQEALAWVLAQPRTHVVTATRSIERWRQAQAVVQGAGAPT